MCFLPGKVLRWSFSAQQLPGINQEDYSSFWENLIEKDPLYANDFIDLGYLGDVSREDSWARPCGI